MPSSLEYLTEWLQLSYLDFISETEKLWLNLDETYLRKEIFDSKHGEKYSPLSIIILTLFKKLESMWVSKSKIQEIVRQLQSSSVERVCPYMLDFCVLMALKGEEVNLYVSEDFARIMPSREYNAIQDTENSDVMVINLNSRLEVILTNVSDKNKSIFSLSNKESEILNILRDSEDVKEVTVKYKNNQDSPYWYDIKKIVRAKDIKKIYRVAHNLWTGKIEIPVDNKKYYSWTITKNVRFDK